MNKYFKDPPEILKGSRGSGRTHRMLQAALGEALTGKTVFILMAHQSDRGWMMNMLHHLPEFKKLFNVHISNQSGDVQLPAGQLRFRSADDPGWSWQRGGFEGYPAGVPVHIDHSAWECELMKETKK